MALKGTLKDFSVADIFQLIGQQGKSGSLYVRTKEKEVHIVFDGGKVVLGTFKKSDEDFLLGTMLLRAGVITAEQLSKAIETQKATLRSLGDILKTDGVVTTGLLSEFISLQLKEVLFRLFQWKDGFYEFVTEKIQYNKAILKPQTAEAVLMDGFRMLDEWPQIMEKVGSLEGVYGSRVSPAELETASSADDFEESLDSAFSDGEDDSAEPPTPEPKAQGYSDHEKKILGLLDGKRPLQEVIYLSRLGTFDTLKALSTLLDRGSVEKVNEITPTRVDFSRDDANAAIGRWLSESYRPLLALFFLCFSVPVVAFGIRSDWSQRYRAREESGFSLATLKELEERESLSRLLEIYRLQNGTYPQLLEELANPSLTSKWDYEWRKNAYVLNPRVGSR